MKKGARVRHRGDGTLLSPRDDRVLTMSGILGQFFGRSVASSARSSRAYEPETKSANRSSLLTLLKDTTAATEEARVFDRAAHMGLIITFRQKEAEAVYIVYAAAAGSKVVARLGATDLAAGSDAFRTVAMRVPHALALEEVYQLPRIIGRDEVTGILNINAPGNSRIYHLVDTCTSLGDGCLHLEKVPLHSAHVGDYSSVCPICVVVLMSVPGLRGNTKFPTDFAPMSLNASASTKEGTFTGMYVESRAQSTRVVHFHKNCASRVSQAGELPLLRISDPHVQVCPECREDACRTNKGKRWEAFKAVIPLTKGVDVSSLATA